MARGTRTRQPRGKAPQPPDPPAVTGGKEDPDDTSDEALLGRMQDQWAEGHKGGSANRKRGAADDKFLVGEDHWDDAEQVRRRKKKRPALVVNAVNVPYFQVTNDIRQNLPQIQFDPDDDDAHPETARILEGMHRHMTFARAGQGNEYRLTAVNHAVAGGLGYYGMIAEYANERDFQLELRLRGVANRDQCVDDPAAMEPDRRDRRYFFYATRVKKAEFRKRYPHNEPDFSRLLGNLPDSLARLWTAEDVPEIEYWWRSIKEVKTISDAGEEDDVDEFGQPRLDATGEPMKRPRLTREDGTPAQTRDVVVWEVRGVLTNGAEILKDKHGRRIEWRMNVPWIPWFLVKGWEINVNGEWHLEGVFHQARDAQKLRDYAYTAMAEHVGKASKAGIMGPKGTFQNFEYKWDTHNTDPWATIEYNLQRDGAGAAVPPMRLPEEPPPQAAAMLTQQSTQMIRDATGMYPVEQGGSPNDPLGTMKSPMLPGAMRQQRTEGDMNHYHFLAGLAVAMRLEADCFLWLAPDVYGGRDRKVRIRAADDTEEDETVTVNQAQPDPNDPEKDLPEGDPRTRSYVESNEPEGPDAVPKAVKHYHLRVGRYGVTVKLGPSFATQREQTLTVLQGMAQGMPQALPILAPFIAKAANIQDADKLSRAFMAMLPPHVQAALSDGQGSMDDVNQLRAKLAAMMPVLQQLMQMNQQLQSELDDKRREQMLKAMELAQRHVSETIQAISHVTGVQMKSEADLLKHFVEGTRGTAERAVAAVAHTSSVAQHAENRVEQAGHHGGERQEPGQPLEMPGGNGGGR